MHHTINGIRPLFKFDTTMRMASNQVLHATAKFSLEQELMNHKYSHTRWLIPGTEETVQLTVNCVCNEVKLETEDHDMEKFSAIDRSH